jgi:hypothetical protein
VVRCGAGEAGRCGGGEQVLRAVVLAKWCWRLLRWWWLEVEAELVASAQGTRRYQRQRGGLHLRNVQQAKPRRYRVARRGAGVWRSKKGHEKPLARSTANTAAARGYQGNEVDQHQRDVQQANDVGAPTAERGR